MLSNTLETRNVLSAVDLVLCDHKVWSRGFKFLGLSFFLFLFSLFWRMHLDIRVIILLFQFLIGFSVIPVVLVVLARNVFARFAVTILPLHVADDLRIGAEKYIMSNKNQYLLVPSSMSMRLVFIVLHDVDVFLLLGNVKTCRWFVNEIKNLHLPCLWPFFQEPLQMSPSSLIQTPSPCAFLSLISPQYSPLNLHISLTSVRGPNKMYS